MSELQLSAGYSGQAYPIPESEYDTPPIYDDSGLFILSREELEAVAQSWVDKYGLGNLNFSKEQELEISRRIQLGTATEEQIVDSDKSPSDTQIELIKQGRKAQRALVENNLRFAFMLARESAGRKHAGARSRFIDAQLERGETRPQRYLGTFRAFHASKSRRVSQEDRYTYAAIGLVKAARSFKPTIREDGRAPASFLSYAAWSIQHEIVRGSHESEHGGVRLPEHAQQKLSTYFGNHQTIDADHKVPDDVMQLLMAVEHREYPEDMGTLQEGGIEELRDEWSEDDRPTGLADVWDYPHDDTNFIVGHNELTSTLDEVLDTLSEREAGVIRLRFGLGTCACHTIDETSGQDTITTHTLDEIGAVFGVTRERIRQIESKTMSKLRHPLRSGPLRGFLEMLNETHTQGTTNSLWRGDAIQLHRTGGTHVSDPEHPQDLLNIPPVIDEAKYAAWKEEQDWLRLHATRDKRWQAFADEEWEDPVRNLPYKATDSEVGKLLDAFNQMPSRVFSRTFSREGVGLPMQALTRFNETLGRAVLSSTQVSQLFESFMEDTYTRFKDELDEAFDPNKVGQFFSRIISENINDNDEAVILRIPQSARGEIGYLASNLGLGRIVINGDAGDYVGAWNHGFADVTVQGNVGDGAGVAMSDDASLHVSGNAGYNLGIGSRDEAQVTALSAKSVGTVYGQAQVIERSKQSR